MCFPTLSCINISYSTALLAGNVFLIVVDSYYCDRTDAGQNGSIVQQHCWMCDTATMQPIVSPEVKELVLSGHPDTINVIMSQCHSLSGSVVVF